MPLIVNGQPMGQSPRCVEELIRRYPHFRASSEALCSQKQRTVPPVGLLYVGQREYAATSPDDDCIEIIGTEDATTCHIVVLRHTGSGAVCVAHFDGCGIEKAAKDMIGVVMELSKDKPLGRLELHLVGGFCDDNKTSEELSVKTLGYFNQTPEEIDLVTACVSDLNDVVKDRKHWPVIYGIAVNVKSGAIFRAQFPDHGPDQPVRSARHFTGTEEVIDIYDWKTKTLKIGPFDYSTMDEIDLLCRLPNNFIREHLSTSPDQEPAHFEDGVRNALNQIKNHPNPRKTVFKNDKPHLYKLQSDGNWQSLESQITATQSLQQNLTNY